MPDKKTCSETAACNVDNVRGLLLYLSAKREDREWPIDIVSGSFEKIWRSSIQGQDEILATYNALLPSLTTKYGRREEHLLKGFKPKSGLDYDKGHK